MNVLSGTYEGIFGWLGMKYELDDMKKNMATNPSLEPAYKDICKDIN